MMWILPRWDPDFLQSELVPGGSSLFAPEQCRPWCQVSSASWSWELGMLNTKVKNQTELGVRKSVETRNTGWNHRWLRWQGKTGPKVELFLKDGNIHWRLTRSQTESGLSRNLNIAEPKPSKQTRGQWRREDSIWHSPDPIPGATVCFLAHWEPTGRDCHAGWQCWDDSGDRQAILRHSN